MNDKWAGILEFNLKRQIVSLCLALICFCICFFGYGSLKAGGVFLCAIIISAMIKIRIKQVWLPAFYAFWFAVITGCTLILSQLIQNEGVSSLFIRKAALGWIICIAPALVFFSLTLKVRLSVFLSSVLLLLLSTINCYVYQFQGNELCLADFFAVQTALNVANGYSLIPPKIVFFCWLIFLLLILVSINLPAWKPKRAGRVRIISVLLAAIFTGAFISQWNDISVIHFEKGSSKNGFLLNFVLQAREMAVKKPAGYSAEEVGKIAAEYDIGHMTTPGRDPDIIVIMNESFSNLEVLGSPVTTNFPVTPFLDSMSENTTKGMCLSSVYGGWTPNSEYEFLSGNSLLFLDGIVFQQYLRQPSWSIVSDLKQRGYACIAMHPYYGNGWKRQSVWPNLLFDENMFLDYFPQKDLIRGLVSDQEMFDIMIQTYEEHKKNEDDKLFMFGVTMQNHGGYTNEGYNPVIQLEGYRQEYPDAEQYLSLIHETDHAVMNLIQYFEKVQNDVVIVFFGDHQPALDESFLELLHGKSFSGLTENEKKYLVPFFIWTNFDSSEEEIKLTSLNFLASHVYEKAGIEMPPYLCYLSDIEKKIAAMNSQGYYSKKDEAFHTLHEAEGMEKVLLDHYWMAEYNSLFDPDDRNLVFFPELKETLN